MKPLLLTLLAAIAISPAFAQAPAMKRDPQTGKLMVEAQYVCPLDGEKFGEWQRAAVYSAGTYLDLKPYGSGGFEGEFPPLPACPTSGLVMTQRHYTPEDVDKLRAFVAAPAYAPMREQETRAFMAARLVEALGAPQARVADRWLKATWTARNDIEYRRYADEALRQLQRLGEQSDKSSGDWITAQLAGLELERRLGRFEPAAERIQRLRQDERFQKDWFAKLLDLQAELVERRDSGQHKAPPK